MTRQSLDPSVNSSRTVTLTQLRSTTLATIEGSLVAQSKCTNICNDMTVAGHNFQFPVLYGNLFSAGKAPNLSESSSCCGSTSPAFPTITTNRWSPEDPSAINKFSTNSIPLNPPPPQPTEIKVKVEQLMSESGQSRGSHKRDNDSTSPVASGQKRKRIGGTYPIT